MLTILLITPIIGIILIAPINTNTVYSIIKIKRIALIVTIINFIVSLVIWINFDSSIIEYQFTQEFNTVNFCHLNIGVDGISIYFVLLTTFIIPICILCN